MFKDFLLKDCKIILNMNVSQFYSAGTTLLKANILEIDGEFMKVKMLEDNYRFYNANKKFAEMFVKDDEVYLNIRHIVAISVI